MSWALNNRVGWDIVPDPKITNTDTRNYHLHDTEVSNEVEKLKKEYNFPDLELIMIKKDYLKYNSRGLDYSPAYVRSLVIKKQRRIV